MSERRDEATAIFASHGVADAVTTCAAARAVGIEGEGNPFIRALLATHGEVATVAVMLAVVAVLAVAWIPASEIARSPPIVGYAVAFIGAFLAGMNVGVVLWG